MADARPEQDSAERRPSLPYASIQLRIVAGILDAIVLFSVFLVFVAVAGLNILIRTGFGGDADIPDGAFLTSGLIVLSFFALLPVYTIALWAWKGQTVGMMAVHIAVADRSGAPLTPGRAFVRTFVWPLSVLPLGIGMTAAFFDDERRALHDILAGTVVLELP